MPTSALTAALHGACSGGSGSGSPTGVCDQSGRLSPDLGAFPCLAEEQANVHRSRATHDLHALAGQSQANSAAQGVDYEISRFQRRGGKEVLPSTSTSVKEASRSLISSAVINSLPPALSLHERHSTSAATPHSATLAALSSLPADKLQGRSVEGHELRLSLLRGTVLVFVTAGYSGKRFVFERAKELGVRSIIIDGVDSWSKVLEEEGMIERFIGLDMSDAETVFDRCLEALRAIKQELGDLDGVLSFCEMAQPLVARLAERLGLPGSPAAAVDAARDKHATRELLAAAGLPTPRHYLITSPHQLQQAAEHVGFPAVIKPISGAASIGVVRVDDFEHLKRKYRGVVREMSAARVVAGALEQGECSGGEDNSETEDAAVNNHEGNADRWMRTTIMMEEYLDGPEVDVDLVFSEGQPTYGALCDNWPTLEPYFNETGSNMPSTLPRRQQRELIDMAVRSTQALGFEAGVMHVELKYTRRGPRLIEVNCRMGGGCVRLMNKLVWGVDLVEEQLLSSAGIPCKPHVAPAPLANVAEYCVNAQRSGLLRDTAFLDSWQAHPDVIYARPLVQPNSKVVCKEDGLPTWVCELMCVKPTIEEAIEFAMEMEADFQLNMRIDALPHKH